jgi:hypothetical protein
MQWLARGGGGAMVIRSATGAGVWLGLVVAAVTRTTRPLLLTAVVTAKASRSIFGHRDDQPSCW